MLLILMEKLFMLLLMKILEKELMLLKLHPLFVNVKWIKSTFFFSPSSLFLHIILKLIIIFSLFIRKYFSRCSEHECVIRDFLLSHHKNLHKKFQEKKASCEAKKAKDKADKAEKAEKDKLEKLRISSEDLDPFKFCLRDEEFLESFESYLTKTYCLENLLFYSEVEQFEVDFDSWTPAQAQEKTRKIFETYVMVGSELEVNIDDTTREAVVKSLKETPISKTIFSNALQEIYKLMETDSYSKWKRTKEYAKIWAKKGSLAFLSPTPTYATAA